MRVFLDTNIWVRLLLVDNESLYQQVLRLLESVELGKFKPYTSTIVLLEVYFVLTSVYKLKSYQAVEDLKKILAIRTLVLIEKTNFTPALELQSRSGLKLTDCVIATQVPESIILCTFDQELLRKITPQPGSTPAELFN